MRMAGTVADGGPEIFLSMSAAAAGLRHRRDESIDNKGAR
jgi:hypothetical protein